MADYGRPRLENIYRDITHLKVCIHSCLQFLGFWWSITGRIKGGLELISSSRSGNDHRVRTLRPPFLMVSASLNQRSWNPQAAEATKQHRNGYRIWVRRWRWMPGIITWRSGDYKKWIWHGELGQGPRALRRAISLYCLCLCTTTGSICRPTLIRKLALYRTFHPQAEVFFWINELTCNK